MPELTAKTFLSTLLSTEILSEQRVAEIEREFGEDCPPKTLAIQLVRSGELTSWQAKFLLSGRDGLRIGKYVLRERLSQDELGDRILAIHQQLDRPVDLQILPAEANEQSPAFQAFLRHASNAAHLDHPSLIHVYDIDSEGGRHYLVSEHFVGQSLDQLFPTATQWNIVKIGSIARQLLGGIFYAHSENVLHGDIGPKTILIAYDGTAKVGNLAVAALRRVFDEHRSGHPVPSTATPESDYQACVKIILQLIDDCQASAPDDRRQLKAILEPLIQSAAERDAEATIFHLDEWLERLHPPKTEIKKSDGKKSPPTSELSLIDALVGDATVHATTKAPSLRKKIEHRKIPIGRLASLVSLGALIIVLGWTWYRANRRPEQQSAARPSAATQFDKAPESRLKRPLAKAGTVKATTETASRTQNTRKSAGDEPVQPPPSAWLKPATPASQEDADPPEKTPEAAPKFGNQLPHQQIPSESIPDLAVAKVAEETPQELNAQAPAPDVSVADKQDSVPSTATDANDAAPATVTSSFANTPRAVDLLSIAIPTESTLGNVDPGDNFLLACNLVTSDTATRRTKFTLEREPGDQSQVWTVVGDTSSGQPMPIGKFSLVGTDLKFQWLVNPISAVNFSFLCNCLLEMKAGNETFLMRLRTPVAIGAATITANEPKAELSFDLASFPLESGIVSTEFLKIDGVTFAKDDEDFTWLIEPADQLVPEREPLFIFMTNEPDRFLFLEVTSKIARKSEITATLRIQQNPRPKPYSEKAAGELDTYLKSIAAEIGQTYQQALVYEAPDGKKRDHAKLVKELKAKLEVAQRQVVDLSIQKRRAAALFSKPIRCRVYFTLEDTEVDLATWDGQPHTVK